MTAPISVPLTQAEIGRALVEFAARKAGVTCSYRHGVRINGVWSMIGDEAPVVVTLEPLPNVVKLEPTAATNLPDDLIEKIKALSPLEVLALSVRAGIHNPDGTLTERYGGAAMLRLVPDKEPPK